MATVNMTRGSGLHSTRNGNTAVPYVVQRVIDFAEAAEEKGSALAANDVIEAINVPAHTVVLAAGASVKTVATGGSSDQTLDIGDGNDPDRYVDGFDVDAAAAGAEAATVIANLPVTYATADTIDVTVVTATTVATAGELVVWAVMVDVSDRPAPGLAPRGG